jgi:rubredoxin
VADQEILANNYRCDSCGWVYDPADYKGLPLADQDDWECPECHSGIDHFELIVPDELGEPEGEADDAGGGFDIPAAERKVSAQKADNSVFELHRQSQKGQLRLQPSFQRYYVWSDKQASALVESLFLRLPIPLVYLAEEKDSKYSVVDGQQRLTSLFRFMENEFAITGLEVLQDLNGKRFNKLSKPEQEHVENFLLTVVRIDKESHPEVKFEVFERLNTGSVKLNDQEVRNAVFRGAYNDLLRTLAKNSTFLRLLGQTEPHKRMSDVELVLRFAAWLKQTYLNFPTSTQLKPFLNKEMENGRTYSQADLGKI